MAETASTERPDQTRAYLVEKNRLLAERVAELEVTLNEKENRIQTLEDEIRRLRSDNRSRSAVASTASDEQGE